MATLPPPKRNNSNSQQYGTGLSPSTMFGSIERPDLISIERPRRKRMSSIEMMMKALRLEEEQLDIDSDESFDSSTGSKQKVGDPRDVKQGSTMIRRSKSNEDSQATCTRRRILAESLATAKTTRINNCESKSTQEEHEDDDEDEESVHESIMASIASEKHAAPLQYKSSKTSTRTIKTAASAPPEEIYHDSRDSLHELTMEIIRNEQAERARVAPKRISSGLKIPSANFESSLFIEEDGLMLLKARTSRKNRHAASHGIDWRHRSFNASSA